MSGQDTTAGKIVSAINVEQRTVASLIPFARNSRTHSDEQVAQIAASIREFGWTNPILVDGENGIIAGHGRLEGAMQFGPSLDKRKVQGLVEGTSWNGFIELNRMAFSDRLPRNSESRALGIAMRLIRKAYPHIEWVISFADGAQCGDGTIYRASGFVLTGIRPNSTLIRLPDGTIGANVTFSKGAHILKTGGSAKAPEGAVKLPGFQLRYLYFLNPEARSRLTVPILPFSRIAEMGAGMYKGQARAKDQAASNPDALGGETPTRTLQSFTDGQADAKEAS